jgi:hypothetical protein
MEMASLKINIEVAEEQAQDFIDRFLMWTAFCNPGVSVKEVSGHKPPGECYT